MIEATDVNLGREALTLITYLAASVLFILKDALAEAPRPGAWGLLAALGPGFSCEALLLRAS